MSHFDIPLRSFEDADAEIIRLTELLANEWAENERLRAQLLPLNWLTAPEVIRYLEAFRERLSTVVEREQVAATILAIKRLQANPKAAAWFHPQVKGE